MKKEVKKNQASSAETIARAHCENYREVTGLEVPRWFELLVEEAVQEAIDIFTYRGSKILWYCKGGGIQKMGPYTDQISASEAITLVGGGKPDDAFVWPEYESNPTDKSPAK